MGNKIILVNYLSEKIWLWRSVRPPVHTLHVNLCQTCLLIAEAVRVLCHLVMFLTVFFYWMYKMKYSCYQDSSVIHGLFLALLVEKCTACQSHWKSNFGWHHFQNWTYSLALAWDVQGLKSLEQFWPHVMAFRSSISTGKPEQYYCLWRVFFFQFPKVKSSVVYAASLCTRQWCDLQ